MASVFFQQLPYPKGATRLDISLLQAEKEFSGKGRAGSPKVLFILSDGVQSSFGPNAPQTLVQRFFKKGKS